MSVGGGRDPPSMSKWFLLWCHPAMSQPRRRRPRSSPLQPQPNETEERSEESASRKSESIAKVVIDDALHKPPHGASKMSPIAPSKSLPPSSSRGSLSNRSDPPPNINTIPGSSSNPSLASRCLRIALVSDFFYPNFGGIESHIYQLSLELSKRGHKVIIITHSYGDRTGVRYLTSGVKVYYLSLCRVYDQVSLPTLYALFPLFRYIILREQIEVVHGHQAFSSMCHEAILNAKTMGIPAVFTDHSLFGFEDVSSILMNKLLKFTLSDVDHVICVSHTSKENTVLRAALDPRQVSVIPNAVVASNFQPNPDARNPSKITIVVISRLVYRKGTDLLIAVIPKICALFPEVQFIIGGDGPKLIEVEQMRETHVLQDRVIMLGGVKHSDVRNVLVQGNIFLNTSLTEAFCIAIVEAVCCGLLVVCTKVGGVPEVLPDHMIQFAEPDAEDLVRGLKYAINRVKTETIDPWALHNEIKSMYDWADVTQRTEQVYFTVVDAEPLPLAERFAKYDTVGVWAGKLSVMIVAVSHWLFLLLEWLVPRDSIEIAPPFQRAAFQRVLQQQQEAHESGVSG